MQIHITNQDPSLLQSVKPLDLKSIKRKLQESSSYVEDCIAPKTNKTPLSYKKNTLKSKCLFYEHSHVVNSVKEIARKADLRKKSRA